MNSANAKTIQVVLASAKKRPLKTNAIVIARYEWLKKRCLPFLTDMDVPNLYLQIRNGILISSYYNNVLVHVIKKQNYHIQILK